MSTNFIKLCKFLKKQKTHTLTTTNHGVVCSFPEVPHYVISKVQLSITKTNKNYETHKEIRNYGLYTGVKKQ